MIVIIHSFTIMYILYLRSEFSFATDYNKINGGHMGLASGDRMHMSGKMEVPLIIDKLDI